LPLGNTDSKVAGIMVNLVGAEGLFRRCWEYRKN
jgi:hypothetical protein